MTGMLLANSLAALMQTSTITAPPMEEAPVSIVQNVEIGEVGFKVTVRGDVAEVKRKAFAYRMNAHHFAMVRRAAELATGCVATDHFTNPGNKVFVNLDCTEQRSG